MVIEIRTKKDLVRFESGEDAESWGYVPIEIPMDISSEANNGKIFILENLIPVYATGYIAGNIYPHGTECEFPVMFYKKRGAVPKMHQIIGINKKINIVRDSRLISFLSGTAAEDAGYNSLGNPVMIRERVNSSGVIIPGEQIPRDAAAYVSGEVYCHEDQCEFPVMFFREGPGQKVLERMATAHEWI